MASFVKVPRKNGFGWQAVIRRKGHRQIKRTFDLKGDAQRWAREQESLITAKRYQDPRLAEMVTLKDGLAKLRKESFLRKKANSTMEREKYTINHLTRLLGAQTSFAEIDTPRVSWYQNTRIEEGASNSSIRQELSMLSKLFNRARKEWKLPVENPVDDIERVPPGPARDRYLSQEEAHLVAIEAKKSRNKKFYPFVLLLLHTGMRTGEAAKLHEDAVNLEKRSVLIKKTKSGKPRSLPLTKPLVESLKMVKTTNGYYFLTPNHLRSDRIMLQPGSIFRDCWRGLRKRLDKNKVKIPHFTPHDIRHTAGTHLLLAGVDIRIIADILGHSTLQMVMRYTHTLDSHLQDVVDKIDYLGVEG